MARTLGAKVAPAHPMDLEDLFVEFYSAAYQYYTLTGHDVLAKPDKQELILQRLGKSEFWQGLLSEERHDLVCAEESLGMAIKRVERLSRCGQLVPSNREAQAQQEQARRRARERCSSFLEKGPNGASLRPLTLSELSRRCLYFTL